jgi:hypothetical protein
VRAALSPPSASRCRQAHHRQPSPADLDKEGSDYDLPIAVGLLVALGDARVYLACAKELAWIDVTKKQPPMVHPPFAEADIVHGIIQLGRLTDAVRAELDLIGMRLTWLVISESFLFSAFAVSVPTYNSSPNLSGVSVYILWTMPLVGMLLAGCVYVAILAALRAGKRLMEQRDQLMERLPEHLRISLISSGSQEYWWGNVPPTAIPPIIFLLWLGAFIGLLFSFYGPMA